MFRPMIAMRFWVWLAIIVLICGAPPISAQIEPTQDEEARQWQSFKARHVAKWAFYGIGQVTSDHGQIVLSESSPSKGVMLVSPDSYCGDTIVRFDVLPLLPATVMVTNLATRNTDQVGITFPEDYDGNVYYMFDHFNMYNFIYHAAAHYRTGPFLRRFPDADKTLLSPASQHFVETGKYSSIKLGRVGDQIWLSVDDTKVVSWQDPEPLDGGHVVLRLRGTAHERGAALIRNLRIANDRSQTDCH